MPLPKPVYKYNMDGNFLAEYLSINLAAKKNGLPFSCIRKAAKGDYSYSGVFFWSYKKLPKLIRVIKSKYEQSRTNFKPVIASKGERKIRFESVSECAKFIGCHRSAISQIINKSTTIKTIRGWSIESLAKENVQ